MSGLKGFTVALSIAAVLPFFGYYIVTPLWLDYFRQNTIQPHNHTNASVLPFVPLDKAKKSTHDINVMFLLMGQWLFMTMCCGAISAIMRLVHPSCLKNSHLKNIRKDVMIGGFAMAISSVLFNYSISGSRTALYLQGLLVNFEIPLQFTTRLFNPSFNDLGSALERSFQSL